MDSRFHGVPISAAQMASNAAVPSYNNNTSSGIRAPLTVDHDSDFESSVSSKSYDNNSPSSSYYRGSESEGFESGEEDELETAGKERPYVSNEHDEEDVVEETQVVKEYVFSRPSVESISSSVGSSDRHGFFRPLVRNFGAASAQDSRSFSGTSVFGPYVRISDERIYDGDANIHESADLGTHLSGSDESSKDGDFIFNKSNSGAAFAQDGGNLSGTEVFRPHVRIPDERINEGAGNTHDSGDSGPYSSKSDESIIHHDVVPSTRNSTPVVASVDEEVLNNELKPLKDVNGLMVKKLHVPIALISGDSDDDSQGSEVLEDEGFSGVIRVPSVEILQRRHSAPKARISELSEEDDDESQDENKVDMEVFENLGINNGFSSSIDEIEREQIFVENFIPHALPTNAIRAEDSDAKTEARADSLFTSEEQTTTISEPEPNVYHMHSDDANQELSSSEGTQSEFLSEAFQFMFQGNTLDQETEKSKCIGQFLEVLENSTLQADIKTMVDEMEKDREFTLLSCQFQETDGRTISDSDRTVDTDDGVKDCKQVIDSSTTGASEIASRLLHTLGSSPKESIAAQALHRLTVAESRFSSGMFHLDNAEKAVVDVISQNTDDHGISLSLLVIGKTGVGKSATINTIFGERKASIDAFQPSMMDVKEITGTVCGVKIKVFDTPGFRPSMTDQSINKKILSSIKKITMKCPPDVVLYVDRLDSNTNCLDDLPLLKLVTSYLGPVIWNKSIVVLTHASSLPPDGSDGFPLSYESFVSLQSQFVRQLISHSSKELLHMDSSTMPPVCLIENKPFPEKNEKTGEMLMHEEASLRSKLLHLCYSNLSEDGLCITFHGKNVFPRLKIKEYIAHGKRLTLARKDGFGLRSQDDKTYGEKLEVCCRRKDYYSISEYQNLESQFLTIRNSKLSIRAGWSSKQSGQICIKTRCSDQLQVAALASLTIASAIYKKFSRKSTED